MSAAYRNTEIKIDIHIDIDNRNKIDIHIDIDTHTERYWNTQRVIHR